MSVPSWKLGPLTPSPTGDVWLANPPPPPPGPGGEQHSLGGEEVGGPNSDEGTKTLVLHLDYNPSTYPAPCVYQLRRYIFKLLRSPGIASKE